MILRAHLTGRAILEQSERNREGCVLVGWCLQLACRMGTWALQLTHHLWWFELGLFIVSVSSSNWRPLVEQIRMFRFDHVGQTLTGSSYERRGVSY